MAEIRGPDGDKLQSYLCSTENNQCWEIRGLGGNDRLQIAKGTYKNPVRDFTGYLNENGWAAVAKQLNDSVA